MRGGVRRFFYFNRCEGGKERKNDADERKAAAGIVSYPTSQTARTEGKNRKNRPETRQFREGYRHGQKGGTYAEGEQEAKRGMVVLPERQRTHCLQRTLPSMRQGL